MQKKATSLVRSPATLNQLDSFAGPNNADTDGRAYTFPTLKQQAAISELQAFGDEKILAWITLIRSIEPGFQHRAGHGGLSSQQLDALDILKNCHDSDIVAWLQYHLLADNVNKQRVKSSPSSPSRHARRPSTKSALRSSNSSFAPSSVFSNSSSYSTPRSSFGYGSPLAQLTEGNTESEESNHTHWCTHEEHPKPVYTCEGWKRHEQEHERGFLCMPDGPVINTGKGRRCALCDARDPSPEHMAGHNISLCIGSSKRPLKKSRKGDMMKHLALHCISGPASAVLADRWRFNLNKKSFSCGFCVTVFSSITDRSNHIDNKHWRCGQNMSAWDLSNVIRGLLLQPEVEAAWQNILRSKPYLVESSLRWKLPLADGLQLRLEMGEETGAILAGAALELSSSEFEIPNQKPPTSTTRSEPMIVDSSYPAARQLVTTPTTALPRPMLNPASNMFRPSALSPRLRSGPSSWTNMNTSNSGFQTTQRSLAQNSSSSFTDPLDSAWLWNQSEPLSSPYFNASDSETDLQSSLYPLPVEWPSHNPGLPLDDNARIQSLLSESGAILISQISSPRDGQESAHGKLERQAQSSNLRIGNDHPNPGLMSTSVDGWSGQLVNHEHRHHSREKPLPNLPSETYRAAEPRSKSPMDLDVG